VELSVGLSITAGFLSVLSPCLLPLLPALAAAIGGGAAIEREGGIRSVALLSALGLLGFGAYFVAAGATAYPLAIHARLWRQPLEWLAAAALMTLGILLIAGLWRNRKGRSAAWVAAGFPLVGIGLAAAWTPCIGPTLATILLASGSGATAAAGTAHLGLYTFGLLLAIFIPVATIAWLLTRLPTRQPLVAGGIAVLLFTTATLLATGRLGWVTARLSRYGAFFDFGL
jgi:cytochrome c-type biogenesis protein